LDIETTGLNPETDKVSAVGIAILDEQRWDEEGFSA